MRVFLSWSGLRSKRVATHLRDWLADVMPVVVEPWMSEADIAAGKRWGHEIDAQLSESTFGIVCLTAANQSAPWLLFEAGALAKSVSDSNVCPYLIDVQPQDLAPSPLTQFQAKRADEVGTWDLVRSINTALGPAAFDDTRLKKHFDKWWPDLRSELSNLPTDREQAVSERSPDEMLVEVLEIARRIDTLEVPPGGWSGLFAEIQRIREAVGTLRQRSLVEQVIPGRHRETRLSIVYPRATGGSGTIVVSINLSLTIFDALSSIWHRLRKGDSALRPDAFTYLWDWVLVRSDRIPLVAGGLIYQLPASVVFEDAPHWSAESLASPLLNNAEWLTLVRGEPQV